MARPFERLEKADKRQLHEYWIQVIEQEGRGLTKWEEGFVESIREYMEGGGWLSERQAEILERIYAEKTP